MRKLPAIALLAFLGLVASSAVQAQEESSLVAMALNQIIPDAPVGSFYMQGDALTYTNGVFVQHSNAWLMADSAVIQLQTGEVTADGHVRIQQSDQVWNGEHIRYNFKTRRMQTEQFRTGKPPVFAEGEQLSGDLSNQVYVARHAFVTTDDVGDPAVRIRASSIKIVPGKYIEAWNAVLFADGIPVFYYPYYRRVLGAEANNLDLLPGYRTAYGPYLLGTYTWHLNEAVDGKIHLDYRERRGAGAGPDLNLRLGRWGEASFEYYYLNDQRPDTSTNNPLWTNSPAWTNGIPNNRQRVRFTYQATPATNLNLKALVNYQSDRLVLHDFFESEYRNNPQPATFAEINRYWDNWSLDAETTPRLNDFFDQVERLPDVKLTGHRQQIFNTPFFYESESSAGYYRMFFAATNGPTPPAYSASRADTFQQLLLPETLFGWLNVTPRAGGRFTYYSTESGPGGTNSEAYRRVFNTGVETSFKASQLWAGATNSLLAINGLRHVIEPSATYVYVPNPTTPSSQLPQFDSALPSLQLLPVQFPDYNNLDSIDSENVVRFGLRNTLQTLRDGQLDTLLDWNLMLDWRLTPDRNPTNHHANLDEPRSRQESFSDLYSSLSFKPRSWITMDSQIRYDVNHGNLNLAFDQLTFTPNDRWSWGLGYWYLRDGFDGFDQSENLVTCTCFYRLNDNWGLRTRHDYNVVNGRLQEQSYTVYRDLRSWTAALTFRVLDNTSGPKDYTAAFTLSLKAAPRNHPGDDIIRPYHLIGE